MNVLRVISSMNPELGGPCQGIRNSVLELSKLGVYTEVVSMDDPDAVFIKNDPFLINAIGKAKGPWAFNNKLIPWLLNHFCEFDIVIIHGLWLYHGYAVLKAIKKYKKNNGDAKVPKIFVMPHGMLDPWFQNAKGRKLKAIRNWLYWRYVEQYIVNEADGVLFTCEEELKLAKNTFVPYHPKNELNIGYGIVSPPFLNDKMRNDFWQFCPDVKDEPFLLFLSRINVKKGIDILINSYLFLKKSGLQLPKLVIAGPGRDTLYGQQMMQLASVDNDIFFTGMLSGDAKWGAFYACEAFILPSHQENFGISVVEALACSKPVLISNQVNIWREIAKSNAGYVSNDSLTGVLDMLKFWITLTKESKIEMGVKAYECYNNYFKIEAASKRMVNLLNPIL